MEGLRDAGFFDQPDLPAEINDEEKVLHHLYPLLDSHGTGVVQPDQLLFLEQNEEKREKWTRILQKRRDGQYGVFSKEDDSNEAIKYIRDMCFNTTRCGKEHWALMPYNPIMGGLPPRETRPQQLHKPPTRSESSPVLGKGAKKVPRFLREFREARRQGKLIGKEAKAARDKCLGDGSEAFLDRKLAVNTGMRKRPGAKGQLVAERSLSALDVAFEADARPATAPAGDSAPLSSSLGFNPGVVGSAALFGRLQPPVRPPASIGWARGHADAEKIRNARKAYDCSFVAKPKGSHGDASRDLGSQARCSTAPAASQSGGRHELLDFQFSPTRSFDFFAARKALGMWNHYDVGGMGA